MRPSASALAWAALAATLAIWASFLVATRAAVGTALGPVEIGLLRFAPAALLFAPVFLRGGALPGGARPRDAALFAAFGGLGFVLLLAGGLAHAPVADAGVFAPAMLPLYVTLLDRALNGTPVPPRRRVGLGLILAGALAVGGYEAVAGAAPGAWKGHLMFSAAALSWAVYTLAFRASGLAALPAAATLALWSALGFLALAAVTGTDFAAVPPATLALQAALQGVLSGFVASFTFFYAVAKLGAARTAAFAALVPILAALGASAILGEPLGALKALGVLVTAAGVALASAPARG